MLLQLTFYTNTLIISTIYLSILQFFVVICQLMFQIFIQLLSIKFIYINEFPQGECKFCTDTIQVLHNRIAIFPYHFHHNMDNDI